MPEDTKEQQASYLAALLEERRGAVIYDRTERLKAIDKELKRIGYEAAKPQDRAETRPASHDTKETR